MGISLAVDDQAEKNDGYLGLLGLDIIRRFNVIIDYPNHKIMIPPFRTLYITKMDLVAANGLVAFWCDKRKSTTDKPVIRIHANTPVTIKVIWKDGSKILKIKPKS